MADQCRRDAKLANINFAARDLVETELARKFRESNREKRRRKVAFQSCLKTLRRTRGAPDMYRHVRIIQRCKKSQPLNVVHMQMREQDVDAFEVRWQGGAQTANARARVQHQQCSGLTTHFHARSIAAVARGVRSWRGQ